MRHNVAIIVAFVMYFALMCVISFTCGYMIGSMFGCFRFFDGLGSIAGMLLIIPIYIFINWVLGFFIE